MENPDLFGTRTHQEGNTERGRPRLIRRAANTHYAKRVAVAAEACRSCEVLEQCQVLLGTINVHVEEPAARGVIAGVLVDPTSQGDAVRAALNMPVHIRGGYRD